MIPLSWESHQKLSSVAHTSRVVPVDVVSSQNQETSAISHPQISISQFPSTSQHHLKITVSKSTNLSKELVDPTRVVEALLTHKNDPDSAWNYFKSAEMKFRSIVRKDPLCILLHILAGSKNHHPILRKKLNKSVLLKRIPIGPDIVDQLVDSAKRFDFELNSVVFSVLLFSFVNAYRFGDAVKCFNRIVKNDITLSIQDINYLLSRLVDNERFRESRDLYNGLVVRGIYDCKTVLYIVCACANELKFTDIKKYLKEAIGYGLKPDVKFLTSVVLVVCKGCGPNCAYELWKEMKELGLTPSEEIFMHLLKAYLNQRDMVGALKVKDEMITSGVLMKLRIAERLMKGCILVGNLDSALGLFEEIVRDGLVPEGRTYSILIRGCCEYGNMKKAKELYSRKKLLGIKPTTSSVNNLVRGFIKANLWKDAFKVFRVECDVMNRFSYSHLISWLCKEGKMNEACNLREEMLSKGMVPSVVAYRNIVFGLCKVGRTSEASDTLKKLVKDGYIPNGKMYNKVVNGLLKENAFSSAFAVYAEMRERGFYPKIITYITLLDGLLKCHNVNLAMKLKNDMRNNRLKLDVTAYGVLIDGFCKCNDMGTARELFDELHQVGLSPNTVVYNSMIRGFKALDNIDAAVTFHKKMIDDGIPCDSETYTSLLDGLLKEGKLLLASNLYAEMLGNGISPDVKTHTVLVNGLCNKQQLKNARQVLQEMKSKSIVPNVLIYYTLVAGFFREGNMQEAFDLHDEMLDSGLSPDDTTYDILVQGKVSGIDTLMKGYVPLNQMEAH